MQPAIQTSIRGQSLGLRKNDIVVLLLFWDVSCAMWMFDLNVMADRWGRSSACLADTRGTYRSNGNSSYTIDPRFAAGSCLRYV